jgi:hypothetical protein
MSPLTAPPVAPVHSLILRPLVRIEARRFVRHPAFLAGLTACVVFTATTAPTANGDVNSGFMAAFFIGVVSMLVTYFQTRSTRLAREALDASPTSVTQRTAAMCLVCLIPAGFGALWLVSFYLTLQIWPLERWEYGTFGPADEFAILLGGSVAACLGGPLLGVAAARWLRFRGAGVVLVVGTVALVMAGLVEAERSAPWNLRLLTPFTFFTSRMINPDAEDSLPGSPWWYLAWLITLCALAVIAALLREAEPPPLAHRLKVAGGVALAVAVTCGLLAMTGGLDQPIRTYPDGHSIVRPVGN